MAHQVITNFNAGELSPLMESRSTLEKYRNGCRTLENFTITPYGPVNRRPGTQYLGAAKYANTRCRLIGLNLSDSNRYIAEIGVGYIRFWANGQLINTSWNPATQTNGNTTSAVVEAVGVDYLGNTTGTTPHPYQEADLRGISVISVNNVAYLAHSNYPPMRLSHYSDTNWTIGEVPWAWSPMGSVNTTATTITPSGTAGSLTSVSLAYTGTAITATKTAHGLYLGQVITVSGGTGTTANYNGAWAIDGVPTADTFTFTVNTAPTATLASATVAYSTPTEVGTSITLTASQGLFQTGHVGSYWQIDHPNPKPNISVDITKNQTSSVIACYGNWSLTTWNYWTASLSLQVSNDGSTNWQTIRTYKSKCDANFTSTGTTAGLQYFRIVVADWAANAAGTPNPNGINARVMFSPTDATMHGYVKITAVSGTPTVSNGISYYPTATATVVSKLASTNPTAVWYEGAFSAVQGYPNVVSLHESRIIFAGTSAAPTSIWGSRVNDFQNFRQGALDADSFLFTLASTTGGRVQWLVSKQALLIGTAQDEWLLSASSAPAAITPGNVIAQKQSHYGSAGIPAMIINDTILYVQRQARKIREFIYTWQSQTWVSSDLTALAEQATRNYIVESAYQRVPDAIYWFVRGDGQLVSMTYEREQQVTGFSRHTTQGLFESVATINGQNNEDEVWVAVNRIINGSTVRYIERLATGQRTALDNADKSSWWYVDAGKFQALGSPTNTITGLSHLNGMTVQVWADSAVGNVVLNPSTGTAYTVSGGSITLQQPASNVLVGLSYTSTICPERIAVDLQDGNSQGRRQNISRSNVKVYNSLAGEVSADAVTWVPLLTRRTDDPMDASPPAYNGWQRTYVTSFYDDVADFYIRQTLPVPMSICAIALEWSATEQT